MKRMDGGWNLVAGLGGVLAVVTGLAWMGMGDEHLWFDEVFGATFAMQSLYDTVVAVLRFDIHPPLYYLQLNLWARLESSTEWLLANSVFWVLAGLAATTFLARPALNRPALAGLLYGLMPAAMLASHSLRMYAMQACLAVCLALLTRRLVAGPGRWVAAAAIAAGIALAHSHALGVLVAAYGALFGLLLLREGNGGRAAWRRWFATYAAIALAALPAMGNSVVRSTSQGQAPDAAMTADLLAGLVAGPYGNGALALLFAVIAISGSLDRATRAQTLAFVVVPVVMALVISHALRPIWLERNLLFVLPFLSIALVRALERTAPPLQWAGLAFAVGGLVLIRLYPADHFHKPTDYRSAAQVITRDLAEGDLVYVPENVSFWGIAWHLAGPGWGSPLAIQDPIKPDLSDRWPQILEKLGPERRRMLHLEPQSRAIQAAGAPMVIGWSPPPGLERAKRVWLVTHATKEPRFVALPGFTPVRASQHHALTVTLLER